MSNFTDAINSKLSPSLAIIVYKGGGDINYYLESHEIKADGSLGAGSPLKDDTLEGLVKYFYQKEEVKEDGLFPENLLYNSNGTLAWFRPPEKRFMYFGNEFGGFEGEAYQPSLIYVANKRSLNIYAFKGSDRPNIDTPLFIAPYPNVSNNGSVCLGNAKTTYPAVRTIKNIIEYWERMFWNSAFTHANGEIIKGENIYTLWYNLVEVGCPFPQEKLLKSTVKLEDAI